MTKRKVTEQDIELFDLMVNNKENKKTEKITREALLKNCRELFQKVKTLDLYLHKAKEITANPGSEEEKNIFSEHNIQELERLFEHMKKVLSSFQFVFDFVYDIENEVDNSFMEAYKSI